jgi:glycosyltransferase involved in cell wall biosynthesis
MKTGKILILNYAFPPNDGVGGRRWAKFCKYIDRAEKDFIVVCKKPTSFNKNSKWTDDTTDFRNKIKFFDFGYPTVLEKSEFSLFDKVSYRVALKKVKLLSKGNYYDRTCLCEDRLKKYISNLILKENITAVIVSVAPFGLSTIIGSLKKEFSNVRFIVDFRDPWTDNETAYGLNSMSQERKQYEFDSEKKVLNEFDAIVSVSDVMTNKFKNKYPNLSTKKFFTIPNGYDSEDFGKRDKDIRSDKINMVFVGNFYDKAKHHIVTLRQQLEKLKEAHVEIFNKVSINFYGAKPFDLEGFENVITFHKSVSITEVSIVLAKADLGLLFLSDDINYSFSTKFCEYLANKLPIIVFSKSGKTGEYVENMKIGIEINDKSNDTKLMEFLSEIGKVKEYAQNFDSSDFDILSLTKDYLNIIEK